jgi:HipA-like protein
MGRQPRGGLVRKLVAFLEDVMVGTLAEADDLWRFDYDPVWASRADAFDLSPSLPRAQLAHVDGASTRSVQWYSGNLLPEFDARKVNRIRRWSSPMNELARGQIVQGQAALFVATDFHARLSRFPVAAQSFRYKLMRLW